MGSYTPRVGAPHTATCGWEKGEYMVLSTDGYGEMSRSQIDEGLTRGALVHCGFDNDAGGDLLWQQVTEAYPRAEAIVREWPSAGAKD